MPLHKKNPDVGIKKTVYADSILIEQEDAKSFAQNEEVGERVGNAEDGGNYLTGRSHSWTGVMLLCAMLLSQAPET